jgi:hypothetical protein
MRVKNTLQNPTLNALDEEFQTLISQAEAMENEESPKNQNLEKQKLKSKKSEAKDIQCENCFKRFKFESRLKSHNCIKICKICGFESPSVLKNSAHLRQFHLNEPNLLPHQCDLCERKFFRKDVLQAHKRDKHFRENLIQFVCDLDGKMFYTLESIKTHIKGHIQAIECQICGKKIKNLGMRAHIENVHNSESNFPCKLCPKSFKSIHSFKFHKKVHDKKFECPICKQKLSHKFEIERHRKAHAREKLKIYECKLCGLKLASLAVLNSHQSIHTSKIRTLNCSRCDYATNCRGSLIKHQKYHKVTDERIAKYKNPVKCDKCLTVLRNNNALRIHMMNVHPIAPYECDKCGRIINTKRNMLKHLKFHIEREALESE